jgi:hypothetical protein
MRFPSASILAAAVAVAALPAQNPVVGVWRFDETQGFTAADSGPLGNHGTLLGFTNDPQQWVPGRLGNALSFDGLDDRVDVPFAQGLPFMSGLGEAFSVCFWVNAAPTDDDRVLTLSSAASNVPLFTLGTGRTTLGNADKLLVYLRDNDNIVYKHRYSVATVFDNTWHHVAYTEHSGEGALYIDGVPDAGTYRAYTGDARFTFDQLSFGTVARNAPCCFLSGAIDDLHVYGFRLTQADVAQVMTGAFATTCRASQAEYGNGCGVGPFDLHGFGSPVVGGPGLLFAMRGGLPGSNAFLMLGVGKPSPLDLTAFGLAGCRLYPASPTTIGTDRLSSFGSSTNVLSVPIPNLAGLACVRLTFQAVSFVGGAAITSDAALAQLGF